MDDVVTCLVRGPASRYPRGFLWLLPAWFVILSGGIVLAGNRLYGHLPLWLGASEIGGLLLAMLTAVCVLLTAKRVAFRADQSGVLLGTRTIRKRPRRRRVFLPWSEVAQVTLVPRQYSVLADIVLSPSAAWVPPPSISEQAALLFGALLMPVGFGRGRPALTMARQRPPGYRVRICDMPAGELRVALHQVAPEAVPIRVVNSIAALRAVTSRSRQPDLVPLAWSPQSLGQQSPASQPPAASLP